MMRFRFTTTTTTAVPQEPGARGGLAPPQIIFSKMVFKALNGIINNHNNIPSRSRNITGICVSIPGNGFLVVLVKKKRRILNKRKKSNQKIKKKTFSKKVRSFNIDVQVFPYGVLSRRTYPFYFFISILIPYKQSDTLKFKVFSRKKSRINLSVLYNHTHSHTHAHVQSGVFFYATA